MQTFLSQSRAQENDRQEVEMARDLKGLDFFGKLLGNRFIR